MCPTTFRQRDGEPTAFALISLSFTLSILLLRLLLSLSLSLSLSIPQPPPFIFLPLLLSLPRAGSYRLQCSPGPAARRRGCLGRCGRWATLPRRHPRAGSRQTSAQTPSRSLVSAHEDRKGERGREKEGERERLCVCLSLAGFKHPLASSPDPPCGAHSGCNSASMSVFRFLPSAATERTDVAREEKRKRERERRMERGPTFRARGTRTHTKHT